MIPAMAWRNIWRNKTRSVTIMLSVAIGLLSGIAVMALYKGMMSSRVKTVIESETGHIQIHAPQFTKDYKASLVISEGSELLRRLAAEQDIRMLAPRSITQGMLSTATGSSGVRIMGIVPLQEYKLSKLNQKILSGQGFEEEKRNAILLGKKLADKMKLRPGSKLVLTFTDTSENIVAAAFRVSGIYQSDNTRLDERDVYIRQEELNSLLGIGHSLHEIAILINRDSDVDKIKAQLQKQYPALSIETWKEISPETALMVSTIDDYSFIILVIIMLALAFGIINTMLMAVLERTREIGMMTALGMNRLRLFLLILLETVFLTMAGAPVGLLSGWILTTYFNRHGLNLSGFGKDLLSSFGYSSIIYPEFPWDQLILVLTIVLGTALVACLFPALKSLQLQPADALRR